MIHIIYVKNIKKKDKRIILLSNKKNKGVSFSRNRGIDISTGDYITFVDSDDYVELDYIEFLYNLIDDDSYDLAVCGFKNKKSRRVVLNQFQFIKYLLSGEEISFAVWGKLYKTNLIKKVRFIENLLYEDISYFKDLVFKIDRVIFDSSMKYHYCIRKGSITFSKYSLKEIDRIDQSYSFAKKVLKKYPQLKGDTKLFYLNSLIATCNKQLLYNIYNSDEIKKTKKYIKDNLFSLLFFRSKLIKKIQILLFLFNIRFYTIIYKFVKDPIFIDS